MISNRYKIGILILLLITVGIIFYQYDFTQEIKPTDIIKIRYGTVPFLGETPAYVAYKNGYFKEQGLDITFVSNAAGFLNLKALFEDRLDIANVADLPIAYSIMDKQKFTDFDRGEFKIFTDMVYSNKIQQVVARRDSGINQAQDIIGKRVGLYRGTTSDFFYDAFLIEHNIEPASVTTVDLNLKDQVDALNRGDVDAIFSWQPNVLKAQTLLGENAILLSTKLTYTTAWLAVAMSDFILENPEVIVRFLRALKKANKYIIEHPKQAMAIHAEMSGVDLHTISQLWTDIDYNLSLSESLITTLEDEIRWIIRSGKVAETSVPDIKPYLYFDAINQVSPEGVTVIQ